MVQVGIATVQLNFLCVYVCMYVQCMHTEDLILLS